MKRLSILLLLLSCATLILDPPQLEAKKSKEPPPELLDPAPVTPKAGTFGSWFLRGDNAEAVSHGAALPFGKNQVPDSDISCVEGIFKIPHRGIYMVTYGITTKNSSHTFELQLSGKRVPGGKLSTVLEGTTYYATGSVTLMFNAKAGEQLQIVNASGKNATIATIEKDSVAAYISIMQIR